MQKVIILSLLLILKVTTKCPCSSKKSVVEGKSALCILHPDNDSGVRGLVTIYQQNEFSPSFFEFTVIGLNSEQLHGCHIH